MYTFTIAHPPEMKDVLSDNELETAALRKTIGTADWPFDSGTIVDHPRWSRTIGNYNAERYYRWAIVERQIHYSEDTKFTRTYEKGLKQTELQKFESETGITITVGKDDIGLKAEIAEKLKITRETSTEWSSKETIVIDTTRRGGHWYMTWHLLDCFEVFYDLNARWGEQESVFHEGKEWSAHRKGSSTIESVKAIYERRVSDEDLSKSQLLLMQNGKRLTALT